MVGTVPRNPAIDQSHPDLVHPPSTDNGLMPNLVFPFSLAHTRQESGGWTGRSPTFSCRSPTTWRS
ncbi:hypothetical protein V2I01_06940 [Micromonospora sp. BRA006-A]|nr:hypothetical protein [Micromonospora sp. BRA006-A]